MANAARPNGLTITTNFSTDVPIWNIPKPYSWMRWVGVAGIIVGLMYEFANHESYKGLVIMALGSVLAFSSQITGEKQKFLEGVGKKIALSQQRFYAGA